jgi:transcriptional regulator with XRE-family HTH domain
MADDDQQEPGVWEHNFRHHMARLRGDKGMTQTDLARALRDQFGLRFHQQIIARIEAGERPIRLNEAVLIARTLNVDLAAMMSDVGSAESVRLNLQLAGKRLAERAAEIAKYLDEHVQEFEQMHEDLENAWGAYLATQEGRGLKPDKRLLASMRQLESGFHVVLQGLKDVALQHLPEA